VAVAVLAGCAVLAVLAKLKPNPVAGLAAVVAVLLEAGAAWPKRLLLDVVVDVRPVLPPNEKPVDAGGLTVAVDPNPVDVEPNGLAVAAEGAAEVAAGVEKLNEEVVGGAAVVAGALFKNNFSEIQERCIQRSVD